MVSTPTRLSLLNSASLFVTLLGTATFLHFVSHFCNLFVLERPELTNSVLCCVCPEHPPSPCVLLIDRAQIPDIIIHHLFYLFTLRSMASKQIESILEHMLRKHMLRMFSQALADILVRYLMHIHSNYLFCFAFTDYHLLFRFCCSPPFSGNHEILDLVPHY